MKNEGRGGRIGLTPIDLLIQSSMRNDSAAEVQRLVGRKETLNPQYSVQKYRCRSLIDVNTRGCLFGVIIFRNNWRVVMRVPSTGPCPIPPTVESGWIHCLLEFICRSYLKNKRIRWSWCYELWVQNCVFSVQHWLGSGLMQDRQKTRKVTSGSFGRCLWKIFITALGQLGPRSPLYTTTQSDPSLAVLIRVPLGFNRTKHFGQHIRISWRPGLSFRTNGGILNGCAKI